MIFNTVNVIIFLLLLAVNLIAIFYSERKRKYGIFPTKFFLVLFIALWVGKVLVYFYVDKRMSDLQFGEIQVLGDFQLFIKGKIPASESNVFKISHLKPVYYLQYIIRIATLQSILAFLLSVYGLIAVYGRNEFYLKMIALHILSIIFCIGMEFNIV